MTLNKMWVRDANAALIVYDCNSEESLENARKWIEELREGAPNECVFALCGNKMDLPAPHKVSL